MVTSTGSNRGQPDEAGENSRNPAKPAQKEYQRAYQACESCRKKKSRCIINADGQPPCSRCQREHRECHFGLGRPWSKRRKTDASESHDYIPRETGDLSEAQRTEPPCSEIPSSRLSKEPTDSGSAGAGGSGFDEKSATDYPPSLARNNESPTTLRRNSFNQSVMRTVVSSGSDALNLLFEAANHTAGNEQGTEGNTLHDTVSLPEAGTTRVPPSSATSPAIYDRLPNLQPDVLEVWNAYRFVKMGWLCAEEACNYVDLYAPHIDLYHGY